MAAREVKIWNANTSTWEFLGLAEPPDATITFGTALPQALGTASAGTATVPSRADHVHVMPSAGDVGAVGTATTITAGTALSGGGDLTTSRTLNVVLSDATPLAVGSSSAGTAATPSRADHVHEGTTLSSATPQALGAASAGTATTASRGDHVHALPTASAIGAVGTATAITAGTALAGGGDLSASRTLNVVLSSTNPAALGTAAAPGTATASVARSDHVHLLPTAAELGVVSNALVTAAGQVVASTGSGTPAVVTAGTTDGHVLTWDSATSTKMKWAAASSAPTFVGCDVYTDVDQSISNNTHTVVTFELEYIDSDGFHSTSSNTSRITIPSGKGGKYRVFGQLTYYSNATGGRRVSIAKNGSRIRMSLLAGSSAEFQAVTAEAILDLVAGDYLELQAYQSSGGSLDVAGTLGFSHFSVQYLGS